jgi:hypothetical protein
MIKFPEYKETTKDDGITSSLKAAVNTGMIALGQRYIIEGVPITCVDIDNDKYIFSVDDIYKRAPHSQIKSILEELYTTGTIDGASVLPLSMMKDIDFLFVPSEYQVFGKNPYGTREKDDDHQFEWYKRGDVVRVKGYRGNKDCSYDQGDTCSWWLCTVHSGYSTYCCIVNYYGHADYSYASDSYGVPVFFQMTRE